MPKHEYGLCRPNEADETGTLPTDCRVAAVKARLKSLNADVEVEQEEYDEVVVIKALFLNHDYQ